MHRLIQVRVPETKVVEAVTVGVWLPSGEKGLNCIVVDPEQGATVAHSSDPEKNVLGYLTALAVSKDGTITLQATVKGAIKVKTITPEKADEILKHLFTAINKEVARE